MSKSPYPRDNPNATEERKLEAVNGWFLYFSGSALAVLIVTHFFMSAFAQFDWPEFLTGLFFVALGIAARASGQARLSQLKGLTKADRGIFGYVLWLPWYLRQPQRPTERSFEDPPPPTT